MTFSPLAHWAAVGVADVPEVSEVAGVAAPASPAAAPPKVSMVPSTAPASRVWLLRFVGVRDMDSLLLVLGFRSCTHSGGQV